jgi:HAD superfamily hydrolase (TIGR01549 family)
MIKIRAIIHDWDDTITNSFTAYSEWYADFADFYDLEVPKKESVKKYWGATLPALVKSLWPGIGSEVEDMLVGFIPQKQYMPQTLPGVEEVFDKLIKRDVKLGILSSGKSVYLNKVYIHNFGEKLKYHKFIHTEEDTKPYHKPDPKVFEKSLKTLLDDGIENEGIIYVGDHIFDYLAAKNAGLRFYAVTTGVIDKAGFLNEGLDEDKILDSFLDIEKVV